MCNHCFAHQIEPYLDSPSEEVKELRERVAKLERVSRAAQQFHNEQWRIPLIPANDLDWGTWVDAARELKLALDEGSHE